MKRNKIVSKEKHFYYQEAARSGKLTMEEYAIYCYLLQYVDEKLGVAYPSLEMIWNSLNTTKKRVMKNLKNLREKGFIDWESGNSRKANTYYFTHFSQLNSNQIEPSIGVESTTVNRSQNEPSDGVKFTTPKENKKKIIKENNKENFQKNETNTNENLTFENEMKEKFGDIFNFGDEEDDDEYLYF